MKIPPYVTAGFVPEVQEQRMLLYRAQALARRIVRRFGRKPRLSWHLDGVLDRMLECYDYRALHVKYTAKCLADRLRAIRNAIRLLYRPV